MKLIGTPELVVATTLPSFLPRYPVDVELRKALETRHQAAIENLRLANGRFDAGVGTILEVTDAATLVHDSGVALADHLRDINMKVRLLRQHLQSAELSVRSARGFFEVGTRPKSDVARAEYYYADAQIRLLEALRAASGTPDVHPEGVPR